MRLSIDLIDSLIANKCSCADLKIVFYLLSIQQENGVCYNVYAPELCKCTGMLQPNFSKRLKKLIRNGIISKCDRTSKGYYRIKLSYYSHYTKGRYVDIHKEIFNDNFFSMPVSEMYATLKLLTRTWNEDNDYTTKCKDHSIAKYANIKSDNKRLIKRIVKNISNFLHAGKKVFETVSICNGKEKTHQFKLINHEDKNEYRDTAKDVHKITYFLKRHKIEHNNEDIQSLLRIVRKYKDYVCCVNKYIRTITLQYNKVKGAVIRKLVEKDIEKGRVSVNGEFIPLE